jgi:hypothetical protein
MHALDNRLNRTAALFLSSSALAAVLIRLDVAYATGARLLRTSTGGAELATASRIVNSIQTHTLTPLNYSNKLSNHDAISAVSHSP